jgi:nucleoid-associated protein YgaU
VWARFDLSMLATMRTLSVEERAGEPDTRYFDIAFTEWKALEVKRARFGSDKTQRVHPTPGQTLRDLAVEYYRDPNKWRVIARANGITGFPPDSDLAKYRRGGRPLAALKIPPITRAERR